MNLHELLEAIDTYRASPLHTPIKDGETARLIQDVGRPDRHTALRGHAVGLAETLQRLFRQVTAGPEKANVLRQTYAFPPRNKPPTEYRESSDDYLLNEHPDNIPSFLRFVCVQAKRSSRYFLAKEERQLETEFVLNNDRFVLSGPKGSGKTVLLNYMLSCFSNILEENQVIWVRVDLTKPSAFSRVRHRFERQTLWILANKYFSEHMRPPRNISKFAQDERSNLNWRNFEDYLSAQRDVAESEQGRLVSYFQTIAPMPEEECEPSPWDRRDPGQSEELLISKLFRHAQRFCLTQGFSFFFILDGLDATHPDTEGESVFESWLSDAIQLFAYDERLSGAFLISLREESRRKFLQRRGFGGGNPRPGKPRSLHYIPVCPNRIIATRFDRFPLQERVGQAGLAYGTQQPRQLIMGLKELCIDFIADGMQIEREKALPYLLQILNGDVRRMLKAVQITLERILSFADPSTGRILDKGFLEEQSLVDLLSSKEKRRRFAKWKGYSVIDVLLRGKYQYFHIPFTYEIDVSGGREQISTQANWVFDDDAGFLINVFDFPENVVFLTIQGPVACAVFHKISILSWMGKRQLGERKPPLSMTSFKRQLDSMGLPAMLSSIYLKEFLYFGLLEQDNRGGVEVVSLTHAGRYVLERLASNFDYVMAIVENTPVPASLFTYFENVDVETDADRNAARLINCVTFVKYLQRLGELCENVPDEVKLIVGEIAASEREYTERMVKAAFQDKTQVMFRKALVRRFEGYAT